MSNVQGILDTLCQQALHPGQTVGASCKQTQKDAVGCFPIYTPEELVYAAGFLPVGMWGGNTEIKLADRYLQGFCCSIMRANIEYGMAGTYDALKAVLLPTLCDTLKCICENWKVAVPQIPIIPVVYPQNRGIKAGQDYLKLEYKRILAELEKISGVAVTDAALDETFALYETWRAEMRRFVAAASTHPKTVDALKRHLVMKSASFMDKKDHLAYMIALNDGLEAMAEESCSVKLIATGLLAEPLGLLELLRDNDMAIVADDLAQESRQFRVLPREDGDTLDKMVWRIADLKGDAFLYEVEKSRGQNLIDMVGAYKADAVVVFQMKFCDPDEFDYPVYKAELEAAGIPHLYLEVEQRMDGMGQLSTRVQSFGEMLL